MAVTNPPERRLNRHERRANLAKAQKAMKEFKRTRGPSVAPSPEVERLNKEVPTKEGLEAE